VRGAHRVFLKVRWRAGDLSASHYWQKRFDSPVGRNRPGRTAEGLRALRRPAAGGLSGLLADLLLQEGS